MKIMEGLVLTNNHYYMLTLAYQPGFVAFRGASDPETVHIVKTL